MLIQSTISLIISFFRFSSKLSIIPSFLIFDIIDSIVLDIYSVSSFFCKEAKSKTKLSKACGSGLTV
jgi:hypothetical protein